MTPDELNDLMEFEHVIEVKEDGTVVDGPKGLYAPGLFDEDLSDPTWTLLDGFSRQDGYSGPIMHPSEYIGGAMAEWILDHPGYYVAIVSFYTPEDEEDRGEVDGWAVAYMEVDE